MHIIFKKVSYWQIPILVLLKNFKFNIYYAYINSKSDLESNKIAYKLKQNNILPLPLEYQKKFSPKASLASCECDPNEIGYKKNIELISDEFLKKYCIFFSIPEEKVKKLRLLLQDFIFKQQMIISGMLGIWSALHPEKKIIYISFDYNCLYGPNSGQNIYKVIIPLEALNYLFKIVKKIVLRFSSVLQNNYISKAQNIKKNLNKLSEKTVALIPNKGIIWGTQKDKLLFEKTLYYYDKKNSLFNKYNILHLDYSNYKSPEKDLFWVCLNQQKISNIKVFFKTLLMASKSLYLIRSWSTFLAWIFLVHQFHLFKKFSEAIKEFKNLKLAIIDYDVLCPKTLILALQKNNIKTVATQERFVHTFFSSYANVIIDTYYTASEYTAEFIKKSKYFDVRNIVPMGQYRSDYLSLFKEKEIPKVISEAKSKGKKVLVILGFQSPNNWYESNTDLVTNWSSQLNLLEDVIKLSKNLKNTFIILRYKGLDWPLKTEEYFKNIMSKIRDCKNIVITDNYHEALYSYKLCANADLIIAKHTSLADECLSKEFPVLFYDYTHNMNSIQSDAFNYAPSELMCYNFDELLERSNSLLFDPASKIKSQIKELNKKIYFVKEKGNIKSKINLHLKNLIDSKLNK